MLCPNTDRTMFPHAALLPTVRSMRECGRCGRYSPDDESGDRPLGRPRPADADHGPPKPSQMLLKPRRRGSSPTPRTLTPRCGPQTGLYTHRCQASPCLVMSRSHKLLVTFPAPLLTWCRACPRTHLYAHPLHMVVDLEEPGVLREATRSPASGAMQHPAYRLRRISLPRTPVNSDRGRVLRI